MRLGENENRSPESIDPTGLWRLAFWLTFVLGSLSLLASWLFAQLPRLPHGADLRPHYITRSCAAVLTLTSIIMARRIWRIAPDGPVRPPMQIVQLIAWVELIIAVVGIIGVAVSRN